MLEVGQVWKNSARGLTETIDFVSPTGKTCTAIDQNGRADTYTEEQLIDSDYELDIQEEPDKGDACEVWSNEDNNKWLSYFSHKKDSKLFFSCSKSGPENLNWDNYKIIARAKDLV